MTSRYKAPFLDASAPSPWLLFRNRVRCSTSDTSSESLIPNGQPIGEVDGRFENEDHESSAATYMYHHNDNVNAYAGSCQNRNNKYGLVYHPDTGEGEDCSPTINVDTPSIASRIKYFEQGITSDNIYKSHSVPTLQPRHDKFNNASLQNGISETQDTSYTGMPFDKQADGTNSITDGQSLYSLPATFQEDVGSRVDNIHCPFVDCACRQHQELGSPHLSFRDDPVHSGGSSVDDCYNHRRIANVNPCACYDSRSSSTDSCNELFDIIVCNSTTDLTNEPHTTYNGITCTDVTQDETKHTDTRLSNGVCHNTAINSPELDLSALDGFRTAPSTSDYIAEDYVFVDVESLSQIPTEMYINDICDNIEETQQAISGTYPQCVHRQVRQLNEVTGSPSASALATFTESLSNTLNDEPKHGTDGVYQKTSGAMAGDYVKNTKKITKETAFEHNTRNLNNEATNKLVFPPPLLLDQDQIRYEVDNESGKVRTAGKGSFGQVYKARFSDPSMYYVPLVVKEFDEEYSRKKDIIEEAQRLAYLWDTGYVPACYGIMTLTNKTTKKESYGIIQEFVGTGLTVEQILWERMDLPTYTWLSIAEQCCEGLSMFHEKGILLNDIKSNNIILDFSSFTVRIKYIDFGLATDMGGRSYRNTKSLDEFVYLAPEIRLSGATTSIPTDIYSLGYMLDQMRAHVGVEELAFITELCMDSRPEARISAAATARLIQDQITFLEYQDSCGYDYGHRPDCSASW